MLTRVTVGGKCARIILALALTVPARDNSVLVFVESTVSVVVASKDISALDDQVVGVRKL